MDLHFWRQIYILVSNLVNAYVGGFMIAFPGVIMSALLDPNGNDIKATKSEATWIAAINGIAGIPGMAILPIIMQIFGRRVTKVILDVCLIIGWIILYFGQSVTDLLLARFIQGLVVGCLFVSALITSEYCHPKRRGYFMVTKKIALTLGVLFCHTFALFCSWRTIAGLCVLMHIPGILMTILWPESPAFLAMKGKFEECEKAYIWIFGNDKESMRQLKILIATQKEMIKQEKDSMRLKMKMFFKKFTMKDFLQAFFISVLLSVVIESTGRHYFMTYVIQIVTKLIGDKKKVVYISMLNDILTLVALILSGVVITRLKRRSMLFHFGGMSVFLMLLISSLLISQKYVSFEGAKLWSVILIVFMCFISHIGAIPVAFALFGEVFSLEHRGVGSSVTGVALIAIYSASLKLSPVLIESIGLSGLFLVCAGFATLSLVILYFILPETKDKSLQDIEFEMKGINPAVDEEDEMQVALAK